jgi:putative oxidoreductase
MQAIFDLLFLVGRILYAGFFIMNGLNHLMKAGMIAEYAKMRGVGSPLATTKLSGLVLLIGGLGVLLGIFTDWALLLIAIFLLLSALMVHHFWTDTDPNQKMMEMVNFTKNMALLGATLMLLLLADWPYSLG